MNTTCKCGQPVEPERLQMKRTNCFAQAALGDPSMKCVATGVTEFGSITGTVVPRFP